MKLNLPILDHLTGSKNILIAGMGGGFDVFCGLPIYFELQDAGYNVHLANFSFSDVANSEGGIELDQFCKGITTDMESNNIYFPELHLTKWFKQERNEDVPIWCFHATGVQVMKSNYEKLIKHLSIDTLLLVDGGVDALNRGDEQRIGTLMEDTISLVAVAEVRSVSKKFVICIGFSAEQDMAYAHVLQNIADLNQKGAYYGCNALLPNMNAFKAYESAVLYVQDQPWQRSSIMNSSIISAVRGQYGDYHLTDRTSNSTLWISPLMSIYWFFDLIPIAQANLLYAAMLNSVTSDEALIAGFLELDNIVKRAGSGDLPI